MGYVAAQHRTHPPRLGHHQPRHRQGASGSRSPSGPPCWTTSPRAATSSAPAGAQGATRSPPSTAPRSIETKAMWNEVVREIPRMWEPAGLHVTKGALLGPRSAQRPPQALRPGPPADLGRVRQPGHVRQGRLARHRRHRLQLRAHPQHEGPPSTPTRKRAEHPVEIDRPVPEQQRHDDQRGHLPRRPRPGPRDRHDRRAAATSCTMVNLYHDTMPVAEGAAVWPTPPPPLAHGRATSTTLIAGGLHAVRQRPKRCASRSQTYHDVGCDQVVLRPTRRGHRARRDPRDDRALRRPGDPRARHRPECTRPPATVPPARPGIPSSSGPDHR